MFFATLASACLLLGCSAARPLHRSPAGIRASLLKRTPVGTRYEAVEAFLRKEGWQPNSYAGLRVSAEPNPKDMAGNSPTQEVRQTITVFLGDYGVLPVFQRLVQGYWLFDTNNQLVEIFVVKHLQGL